MAIKFDLNGYIAPGIYKDLPEDIYHSGPEVSNSKLKTLGDSPHLYNATYNTKQIEPYQESDPMELGSYFHTITLEPHKSNEHIICAFGATSQKGKKERMEAQNNGIYPITQKGYDAAQHMRDSTLKDEVAAMILQDGHAEVSFFGKHKETGLNIRSRADLCDEDKGLAGDLKSIRDINPMVVRKTIEERRWHVQQAFYIYLMKQHGINISTFIWIVTESKPPYTCIAQRLSDQLSAHGRETFSENMQTLKECIESDTWPVYNYQSECRFEISPYAYNRNG